MVMGVVKFLKKDNLSRWAKTLSKQHRVLVPKAAGRAVEFGLFDEAEAIVLETQATAPPKKSIFPQTETLLRFKYQKDAEHPEQQSVEVQETLPEERTVVLGCRPCGARGFLVFDPVFSGDQVVDPYYRARREQTLIVSLTCKSPANTCFCNWVGSDPADASGSDVLMTPISDGFLLEAVTDRGEQLVESAETEEPSQEQITEAQEIKEKAAQELAPAPDLSDVPEKLRALFDNQEFWEEMAAKCISCGACTYLCPTCYCFNISDEYTGLKGKRIRTWDNCMSSLFTLEASGHNPRETKAKRLRNRVGHKFCYYPNLHDRAMACCGCGRCIKSCPVAVDIREIVLSAKESVDEESVSS